VFVLGRAELSLHARSTERAITAAIGAAVYQAEGENRPNAFARKGKLCQADIEMSERQLRDT